MSAFASIATTTLLSLAGSALVAAVIAGSTGGLAPIIAASLSWSSVPAEEPALQPPPPMIPLGGIAGTEADPAVDISLQAPGGSSTREPASDAEEIDLAARLVPAPDAVQHLN